MRLMVSPRYGSGVFELDFSAARCARLSRRWRAGGVDFICRRGRCLVLTSDFTLLARRRRDVFGLRALDRRVLRPARRSRRWRASGSEFSEPVARDCRGRSNPRGVGAALSRLVLTFNKRTGLRRQRDDVGGAPAAPVRRRRGRRRGRARLDGRLGAAGEHCTRALRIRTWPRDGSVSAAAGWPAQRPRSGAALLAS